MKSILFALTVVLTCSAHAQISVLINGSRYQRAIATEDLQQLAFQLKLKDDKSAWYYGRARLSIRPVDTLDIRFYTNFYAEVEGDVAVHQLLKDTAKRYVLYDKNAENTMFHMNHRSLIHFLDKFATYTALPTITFEVSVSFEEKIGFDNWGTPVVLGKPIRFSINNNGSGIINVRNTPFYIDTESAMRSKMHHSGEPTFPLSKSTAHPMFDIQRNQTDVFFNPPVAGNDLGWHSLQLIPLKCKDREAAIEKIKVEIRDYFVQYSNYSSNNGNSLLSSFLEAPQSPSSNYWAEFFPNGAAKQFMKKENKSYKTEEAFTPVTYGILSGYQMEFPLEKGYNSGNHDRIYVCAYLFRDPTDPSKVLFFYKTFVTSYTDHISESVNSYHDFFSRLNLE